MRLFYLCEISFLPLHLIWPHAVAASDPWSLAAHFGPVTGKGGTAMQRATSRAKTRVARLLERTPTSADQLSGHALVIVEGITAVQVAIQRFQQGGDLTLSEAAWLAVVLRDIQVRDDAWSRLEAEGHTENLRLLLDLTRLARPGYVAAPATLLAFVAWQSGNSALANVALDRALADDRNYRLAQTIRWAVNLGLPPRLAQVSETPEEVAELYASRGDPNLRAVVAWLRASKEQERTCLSGGASR